MKILKISGRIGKDGHIHLDMPTKLPAGKVELTVIINLPVKRKKARYNFSDLAGKLKWRGNALVCQRKLRDEW